ncbi:hypothetical protein [Piscirickettsia litoralis]|uniref:Uncharacterized protein n=1 Tax=Piscirickettsia litoralis TaxID=1891921 RepID=A0ABX3A371_9GAMM|nr:hypothetical protein [Piscirickettsia litoralis]ODN42081.1 hypothetical protein BGC07_02845 [Piscirickettsia litoralis]
MLFSQGPIRLLPTIIQYKVNKNIQEYKMGILEKFHEHIKEPSNGFLCNKSGEKGPDYPLDYRIFLFFIASYLYHSDFEQHNNPEERIKGFAQACMEIQDKKIDPYF